MSAMPSSVFSPSAGRRDAALPVPRHAAGVGPRRPRTIRGMDQTRQVRPDRARCRSCKATHVMLAAGLLPHRGYGIDVIGAALLGAARGRGHRAVATELKLPAATVRSWLRRARGNSEPLRRLGVQTVVAVDPELLPTWVRPTRWTGSPDRGLPL